MGSAFETALNERVETMLDACTKCGKCFEACPITGAAGIAEADPRATIVGVLDIVRTGDGPQASRKWASSCVLSGECIKVCDYGVNPRFMVNMARVAAKSNNLGDTDVRRAAHHYFNTMSRSTRVISRLQLPPVGPEPSSRYCQKR